MIINSEGKFADNYYLIDAMVMGLPKYLSVYVIENKGMRLIVDVGTTMKTRKIIRKLKALNLFPIHKIVLTHSHWDHASGISKFISLMGDTDTEVLASENAIENLKHPEIILEGFDGLTDYHPYEGVTPLKEGDIIDLNGMDLEIVNFFGHTMDSIAILDRANRTIFVGDAIISKLDQYAFNPPIVPPDFHENKLLKTYEKLRDMENDLNSVSLAHFGVWGDTHFTQILNEMEDLYFKTKNLLIEWYNENPSNEYITKKYCKTLIPNSKFWDEKIFTFIIDMMIKGLKSSGYIK